MSDVNEAAQAAREQARRSNGEFGEQHLADPGNSLLSTSASDHELVDVLARYGLTVEDVPGIEQAWTEQFELLDQPRPETVGSLAEKILGEPNWGRHRGGPWLEVADDSKDDGTRSYDPNKPPNSDEQMVLRVHTRNGGGNREHDHDDEEALAGCIGCVNDRLQQHPLYLSDTDDDFDQTYADFLFQVPDEHRQAFMDAYLRDGDAQLWDATLAAKQQIADGRVAPWRILASDDEVAAHAEAVRRCKQAELSPYQRESTEKRIDTIGVVLAAANTGTYQQSEWGRSVELIVDPAKPADFSNKMTVRVNAVAELGAKTRQARARQTYLNKIRAEVDSGSLSPELVDYLTGERPERHYNVEEGKGRNRRTVTKTYRPKPPFLDELGKVEEETARLGAELDTTVGLLNRDVSAARQKIADSNGAKADLAVLADQEWLLGWTGGPADVPPRPASATGRSAT